MEEIEKQQFNFNDAVQQLLSARNIHGENGVLAPLVKQLVEAALEAELDSHITKDVFSGKKNRKNGKTSKTIKSTKSVFPNDNSLLKLLYMGIQNTKEKWTMPIINWSLTISQLFILFEWRFKDYLEL